MTTKTLTFGVLLLVSTVRLSAQAVPASSSAALPFPRTGEDIYRAACATCHALDGRGSPRSTAGFEAPLPDFTDCAFATAEPDPDWQAVVHEGGPVRGLDRHMPAFGDALAREDIALAVNHLRSFCQEPAWPRGDLNLPRAFFTEKAFPENEAVWATAFSDRGQAAMGNEFVYERRLGARNQFELVAPVDFQQDDAGGWQHGVGDVALAFKRTLHANASAGRIAAAGVEVILPTGDASRGLGNGYTVFEPFAMWGQVLPRNSFFQLHGGVELPTDTVEGAREGYLRAALGTTLAQDGGFGRAWSPQVELLLARPQDSATEWDVVPQIQVTLSKLQHVMVAGGVRIPLNQRDERPVQGLFYLLWDWFDGGFLEFWK